MGCNSTNLRKENIGQPRRERWQKEIKENIEDNKEIVQENKRMLHIIDRQIGKSTSSKTVSRLKKLKTKLVKENEEVIIHSDVLRQFSNVASEVTFSSKK